MAKTSSFDEWLSEQKKTSNDPNKSVLDSQSLDRGLSKAQEIRAPLSAAEAFESFVRRKGETAARGFSKGFSGFDLPQLGPVEIDPITPSEKVLYAGSMMGGIAGSANMASGAANRINSAIASKLPQVTAGMSRLPGIAKRAMFGAEEFGIMQALRNPNEYAYAEERGYGQAIAESMALGAGMPLAIGAGKKIGGKILDVTEKGIQKTFNKPDFSFRYMGAVPKDYAASVEKAVLEEQQLREEGVSLAKKLMDKLSPEQQIYANRLITGLLDTSGKGSNITIMGNRVDTPQVKPEGLQAGKTRLENPRMSVTEEMDFNTGQKKIVKTPSEEARDLSLQREVSANIGFDPEIQAIRMDIDDVEKMLASKAGKMRAVEGQVYISPSGNVEKAGAPLMVDEFPPYQLAPDAKEVRKAKKAYDKNVGSKNSPEVEALIEAEEQRVKDISVKGGKIIWDEVEGRVAGRTKNHPDALYERINNKGKKVRYVPRSKSELRSVALRNLKQGRSPYAEEFSERMAVPYEPPAFVPPEGEWVTPKNRLNIPAESVNKQATNPPQDMADPQLVLRSRRQLKKGVKILEKAPALERKSLLALKKELEDRLEEKVTNITTDVRDQYKADTSQYLNEIYQSPAFKKISKVAAPVTAMFMHLGYRAMRQGLLDPTTYAENFGKYLPRMYLTKEAAEIVEKKVLPFLKSNPNRMKLDRFMKRKDIPHEVRLAMGQFKTASYPAAKGISQLAKDVTVAEHLKRVADNPAWVKNEAFEDFVKMADSENLGPLKGKWVQPAIAADINTMRAIPTEWDKFTQKMLSWWKAGKTLPPFSIATSVANVMTNVAMQELSGGPALVEQISFFGKYAKSLAAKKTVLRDGKKQIVSAFEDTDFGRAAKELKKAGIINNDFTEIEIQGILDSIPSDTGFENAGHKLFTKFFGAMGKVVEAGGKAYQGQDTYFKIQRYIHDQARGLSKEQAMKNAVDNFFDYSKVANWVKTLRRGPVPFITYTTKAVPAVVNAIYKDPLKVYKYKMMMDGWNDYALDQNGVKDKDVFYKVMRDDLKGRAVFIMPYKDSEGRFIFVDMTRAAPLIGSYIGDVMNGVMTGNPGRLIATNPAFGLAAQVATSHDTYGRSIHAPNSSFHEKAGDYANVTARTIAPPLVWNVAVDLRDVKKTGQDIRGRQKELGDVWLRMLFGVNVQRASFDEMLDIQGGKLEERRRFDKTQAMNVLIRSNFKDKKAIVDYYKKYKTTDSPDGLIDDIIKKMKNQSKLTEKEAALLVEYLFPEKQKK